MLCVLIVLWLPWKPKIYKTGHHGSFTQVGVLCVYSSEVVSDSVCGMTAKICEVVLWAVPNAREIYVKMLSLNV